MNIHDDDIGAHITLTVGVAREINCDNDELMNALDEAQAPVFGGERKRSFVIVEIIPGGV